MGKTLTTSSRELVRWKAYVNNRLARARRSLVYYRDAGKGLCEIKGIVGHGNFTDWLEANLDVTPRQARKYMDLYQGWAAIAPQYERDPDLGLNEALAVLVQPKDRVLDLVWVPPGQVRPHPLAWRAHNERQRAALRRSLEEVGVAKALLARRLDDGTFELIDGHLLLSELANQETVPVLVLDVSAQEANALLASLDPVTALQEGRAPAAS
jgi:hypothetical protein